MLRHIAEVIIEIVLTILSVLILVVTTAATQEHVGDTFQDSSEPVIL